MRRVNTGWLGLVVLVAVLAAGWPVNAFAQAAQAGTAVKPEALAGSYQGTATSPNGDLQLTVTLKYEKGAFTGTIEHTQGDAIAITAGTLTGDRLVLSIDMGGAPGTITCTVKDPARVEGTWALGDQSGTVVLTRAAGDATKPAADKAAPAATPPAGATGAKPPAAGSDPITGEWDGVTGNNEMSVPFSMRLKLEGDKVTGDISSDQGGAPLSTRSSCAMASHAGMSRSSSSRTTFTFESWSSTRTTSAAESDRHSFAASSPTPTPEECP